MIDDDVDSVIQWMASWVTILHSKAILGLGQLELMRWNLVWIMPQVQAWSLDLLTCSPACYDCATVASAYLVSRDNDDDNDDDDDDNDDDEEDDERK